MKKLKLSKSLLRLFLNCFLISTLMVPVLYALETLTEVPLNTDQLYQTTSTAVAYVDSTGRLFSSELDGTNKKYLSGVSPEEGEENENQRILVFARQKSEFAIVTESNNAQYVYFQARENRQTSRYFLYKVKLRGGAAPEKISEITRPFAGIELSADKKQLFLYGYKYFTLKVGTQEMTELPIRALTSSPIKISPDFKYVAYLTEVQTPSGPRIELRSFDVTSGNDRSLLQGLDDAFPKMDISVDSSFLAVQRKQAGRETLVVAALDGSSLDQVYPLPSVQTPHNFGYLKFVPGLRSEDDKGALLFLARSYSSASTKLFFCDLNDFSVSLMNTGDVEGEQLENVSVTPDFSKVVFQRRNVDGNDFLRPKNYSLDIFSPSANPVFLFESQFSVFTYLKDSSALIYVSSGGFYARNEIVKVTFDRVTSEPLSTDFPLEWIKPEENISSISSAGDYVLFTIVDTTQTPVKYKLLSFKR